MPATELEVPANLTYHAAFLSPNYNLDDGWRMGSPTIMNIHEQGKEKP